MANIAIYTPKSGMYRQLGLGTGFTPGTPGMTAVSYTNSTAIIPNPERGFFQYTETHYQSDDTGYTPLSASTMETNRTTLGRALVFRYFVIEKYLNQDTIDTTYLDLLKADFAAARSAGVKLVIRFSYSNSGDMTAPYGADPAPARVISHIQQLAPAINEYADVIDSIQTGFIGMWGEWYYTDNFGDQGVLTEQNWIDRIAVVDTLLDYVDSRVFILVRYVGVKHRIFGDTVTARSARVGFHNDAFLAPYDDYGTYTTFTSMNVTDTRAYLQNQQNIPMGGESAVGNSPHSDWPNADTELATYHWTFLNPEYHADVLNSWGSTGRDEAARKLGYRLRLTSAEYQSSVAVGGPYALKLNITNDGYASPHRNRPVQIIFSDGTNTYTRTATADIRNWEPGTTATISTSVTAPAIAGTYNLYLCLPDASAEIATAPAYAIQLANTGLWDGAKGWNDLQKSVVVS